MIQEETSSGAATPVAIPLSTLPVYECGAVLFAYLAFPGANEENRRGDVQAALCHQILWGMGEEDQAWAWSPQTLKPGYLLQTEAEVRASLRTFDRRIRDRLVAARMVMPFILKGDSGRSPKLPKAVRRLSIKQMAELVLPDANTADPENVETRAWKPSLPVLHLAAAVAVVINDVQPRGASKLPIEALCRVPEAVEFIVKEAERYSGILRLMPRFEGIGKSLVLFHLK